MTEIEKTEFKLQIEQVRKGVTSLMHSYPLTDDQINQLGAVRAQLDRAMREIAG
jgi:hypothetical protein